MLYDFNKKTDFSYLKGLSDNPIAPIQNINKINNEVQQKNDAAQREIDASRKTYTGSFWQKASDVLSTPLNAFGGFLTGARKKSEEIQQATPKGQVPILNRPTAPFESLWAGVQNIPQGIEKRISPGTYMKETLAPGSTGVTKAIAENPVAQFGADLFADPVNFIPFGKMAEVGGKVLNKIPGVSKVAEVGGNLLSKVGELPIVKNLGKKFIKGYGVQDDVVRAFDTIPEKAGLAVEGIIEKQKQLMQGLSPKAVESLPYFLEPEIAKKAGVNMAQIIEDLGPEFEKMRPIINEEKKILQDLAIDMSKRNNIDPGKAADYIRRQYFPHIFETSVKEAPSVSVGTKIGVKQGYLKQRKGVEGFTMNTPYAVAKRQIAQTTDNFIQDALRGIAEKYGQKVEMIGNNAKELPEGFKTLSGTHTRLKDLRGIALPENIADYIDQTLKESDNFTRLIDKFNSYWKPTATSMNPGFHLTNMIGNMYNSFLGGVTNPKRFFQMVTGTFSPEEEAFIKGSGILQRGEFYGNAAKEAFGTKNEKIFQIPNKIGALVENNARKSLFLDAMEKLAEKGVTGEEATKQAVKTVDKFLFNYQTSLTPFEKNVMKRFFPFYTWFRSNVPLQIESVYKQTAKPAAALKTIKALNNNEMPEDLSVPAGKDAQGNDLKWKAPLPLQDLQGLSTTDTSRDMLNPLLKILAAGGNWALSGGKQAPMDYFTGQTLTDPNLPADMQIKDVASAYGTSLIRPLRTFQKIKGGIPKENQNFAGAIPGLIKSKGNVLRSLMGGFSKVTDKEQQYISSIYDKKDRTTAIKSLIKKAIKAGDTKRVEELERLLE